MRLSQIASRRSVRQSNRKRARGQVQSAVMDALESRKLFAGETVSAAISPILASTTNPSSNSITLNQHFTDATIPGTVVTFVTTYGTIKVALTDSATPLTVANFLNYVNSGAYANTIIHRSALLSSTGGGGTPKAPADIIQGGGYVVKGTSLTHITTGAAVKDEYTTRAFGDIAGTLAMAKTSSANSATSEWYFNVHDNTSALDTPTTDSSGTSTSYTVFGNILSGVGVVDQIAALPTYQISSALTTVPVSGVGEGKATKKAPITANNLVYTKSITSTPGTTYTVTSDNYSLVNPTVTNGTLSFQYPAGKFGTATIDVLAKNVDGTSASTSFTVTVPNTATPTAGPTTAAVTAPTTTAGTTGTFSVLDNSTDSVAALNPASVAIVTQPAHGTATVNTSTGQISYTPTAGYVGADTLTYTVADTAGTTSPAATATLNVAAAPVTLTIGTATVRSLTFTQPNGSVGHLVIGNGAAVVTFASSAVTITQAQGVATATGAGATIASVVITNRSASATLSLQSTGGVTLGSVSDAGRLSIINAPNATLTGVFSLGSVSRLIAAAASDATLTLGSGTSVSVLIPTLTNTNLTDTGSIARISSKQWLSTDGGYYAVVTPRISQLNVTGTFADVLALTSTGTSLGSANVLTPSAAWTLAGSAGTTTVGSPAATWSLAANGSISKVTVLGNLAASTITAPSITRLSVKGSTTGAKIQTSATYSSRQLEIRSLKFDAVSGTTIAAAGSIGSLSALSMSENTISAATLDSVTVTGSTLNGSIGTTAAAVRGKTELGRLHFGSLSGTAISAAGNLGTLSATSLATNTISAEAIAAINIAGAANGATISTTTGASTIGILRFGGALTSSTISTAGDLTSITAAAMTTNTITASAIQTVSVNGTTSGLSITTTTSGGKIARLRFGGAVGTTTVSAAGSIGTISAASFTGTRIYAGVTSSVVAAGTLPTTSTDLSSNTSIGSVTLGKAATAFSNSIISADTLGPLNLGNVATANSGTAFGVSAHTIKSISANLVPGGTVRAGAAQLKSAATLTAYETAQKITLGDFKITLF